MRSRSKSNGEATSDTGRETPATNPWRPFQPAVLEDLDTMTGTIGSIRAMVNELATEREPTVTPIQVLIQGQLLRLLAESVYWNLHDPERWRGAPRCGRVVPTVRKVTDGPCGREYGHEGTCTPGIREDMDDVVDRARMLATTMGRIDHALATLSLSINRRQYDGADVGAVARNVVRSLPDRLIWIAQSALDLLERVEQSSDIQRWIWRPPPESAPSTRTTTRSAT